MIQGIIIGDKEAIARFDRMPARLHEELRIGIGRAALMVQRHTMQDKLSGQVLNVRTGRLRRSINVEQSDDGNTVKASVGTNVEYAHIHEFGFQGTVSVREHLRTTKKGFRATVHAHDRRVNVPEKSFLRSALADMGDDIRAEFEQAIQRSISAA